MMYLCLFLTDSDFSQMLNYEISKIGKGNAKFAGLALFEKAIRMLKIKGLDPFIAYLSAIDATKMKGRVNMCFIFSCYCKHMRMEVIL